MRIYGGGEEKRKAKTKKQTPVVGIWTPGGEATQCVKVRGTGTDRKSLDNDVLQVPPDIPTEVAKHLKQQELAGKPSFLQRQLLGCPPVREFWKPDGMIITYQIFYRQLKLFNFSKGLIISFHFIHILRQVLKNTEKGRKRKQDEIRQEMSTALFERKHIINFISGKSYHHNISVTIK